MNLEEKSKKTNPFLIGCGIVALTMVIAFIGGLFFLFSLPEGGVKLSNQMDDYAIEYLDKNNILKSNEKVIAYYDVTFRCNGEEAAILTDKRVIYHVKGREDESIELKNIEDIDHTNETLIGNIINVKSKTGKRMQIEIAPFNGGSTFIKVLREEVESVQN